MTSTTPSRAPVDAPCRPYTPLCQPSRTCSDGLMNSLSLAPCPMVEVVQRTRTASAFAVLATLAQIAAANTEIAVFGPVFCASDAESVERIGRRLSSSWKSLSSSSTVLVDMVPGTPTWIVLVADYDSRTAFRRFGARHALDHLSLWIPDTLVWFFSQRYTLRLSWPANVRVPLTVSSRL